MSKTNKSSWLLIIDDEENLVKALARSAKARISDGNDRIKLAINPSQAEGIIGDFPGNITSIICDINLGGERGVPFLIRMLEALSSGSFSPADIIFITGDHPLDHQPIIDDMQGRFPGIAISLVRKPFNTAKLMTSATKHL